MSFDVSGEPGEAQEAGLQSYIRPVVCRRMSLLALMAFADEVPI
jgi:hypothetical protein